jgi:hypothetical protein
MNAETKFQSLAKNKVVLIQDTDYVSPGFTIQELGAVCPSLTGPMDFYGKPGPTKFKISMLTGPLAESAIFGQDQPFKSTLIKVIHHSSMKDGVILKGYNIPAMDPSPVVKNFATDRVAFFSTMNQPFSDRRYPYSSTSFCHFSLTHAKESFRIEPEGAMTHITTRIGLKIYFLAWKKGGWSTCDLPQPRAEWLPDDEWTIEVITVPAGSTM